jgi:hypothetical protein
MRNNKMNVIIELVDGMEANCCDPRSNKNIPKKFNCTDLCNKN